MLNIIWPLFIIISYSYSIISGNINEINNSIFDSAKSAVELTITFFGTICLWNGIIQITKETTLMKKITKILNPIINFLFPKEKNNSKAKQEMSMNIVANILGLGNAATPLGLNAMQTLQKENPKKDTLTDTMMMFIILNTASLQIIPTTVIAIRSSLHSSNPSKVIVPIWIATICAAIAGEISAKIIIKNTKY